MYVCLCSVNCTPLAVAAMLLGLNVMRELPELQSNFVHYAIYMVSASVGLIISVIIFYNLYTVNYDKSELRH